MCSAAGCAMLGCGGRKCCIQWRGVLEPVVQNDASNFLLRSVDPWLRMLPPATSLCYNHAIEIFNGWWELQPTDRSCMLAAMADVELQPRATRAGSSRAATRCWWSCIQQWQKLGLAFCFAAARWEWCWGNVGWHLFFAATGDRIAGAATIASEGVATNEGESLLHVWIRGRNSGDDGDEGGDG